MTDAIGVAVVGLGKIGQYLDANLDPKVYCLSHASAVSQHSAFRLVCGIDPDSKSRDDFAKRFSASTFSSISEAVSRARVQGVVVCGPTARNLELLREALSFKPRFILMEKPMGQSLSEAQSILRLCQESGAQLAVNFIRRAEPGVLQVKDMISLGRFGRIEKAIVTYSKGLFNNASHFVNLLRFWLGPSSGHQVMGSLGQNYQGDPEPDFVIRFGETLAYFMSAKEENYSVRDIELIGSRGGLQYLRGGLKIKSLEPVESKVFKGYRFLELEGSEIPSQLNRCQYFVMDTMAKALTRGQELSLSGEEALRTMEDIERIKNLCQVH